MKRSGFGPRPVLHQLIPAITPEELKMTWNKMTSLMVVRHPLDRLVSLYNNKFIDKGDKKMLWMTDFIIGHYREKEMGGEDHSKTVRPEELVR